MPSHQNYDWRTGRHNVSNIPNNLKCRLCNRTKPREQYSNNELASFIPRHPDNLRCMACLAVNQATEIECAQCGETKDIYKFSKSSRKNGGSKWCIECTLHKEDGAPVQQDADDYQPGGNSWETGLPVGGISQLSIVDGVIGRSTRDGSVIGSSSGINAGRTTHVTDSHTFGQGPGNPRPSPGWGYVPPHLRELVSESSVDDNRSVASSVSNAYKNDHTSTTSSTAGKGEWKERGAAADRRRQYTGYAPDGTPYTLFAFGSEPASSASLTASTPEFQSSVPSSRPIVPPTNGRSGDWARATGSRTSATRFDDADDGWPAMPKDETHKYDSDDRDEP